ncbi:1-acyl-sn-glycerol-3-phosphate acyltransferase [bacterium]|nr:1-acyl-sn-glycerol-3-phosphate acyltransferase [bacterium]
MEVINGKSPYLNMNGGLILCSNHTSSLDPIVICAYFPRPIYFISKIELFRNRFLRSFFGFFNSFPIDRTGFGRNPINNAVKVLKSGNVFGIFPEGTRSDSGELGEIRKGIGLIAYLSHASILPIAIYNSKKVSREKNRKNLFLKIKIIFGELIDTDEIISNYSKKEAVEKISDTVMDNIKELYSKLK